MPSIEIRFSKFSGREGEKLTFEAQEILIGRSMACDLRLRSDLVSRMHSRLFLDGGRDWRIEDLNSRNGTFLNGRQLAAPARVVVKDLVQFGPNGPRIRLTGLDPAPRERVEETGEFPIPEVAGPPAPAPAAPAFETGEFLSAPRTGPERLAAAALSAEGEDSTEEFGPGHARRPRFLLRALACLLGLLVGGALGFQAFGGDLPYAQILSPCLAATTFLAGVQAAGPAGWLLPAFAGLYGLAIALLLTLGWRGWVTVVILGAVHVGVATFLADPEAFRGALAAARGFRAAIQAWLAGSG